MKGRNTLVLLFAKQRTRLPTATWIRCLPLQLSLVHAHAAQDCWQRLHIGRSEAIRAHRM